MVARIATVVGLLPAVALLAACTGSVASPPNVPSPPPAHVALADTGSEPFEVTDFTAVHGPGEGPGGRALIFGALSIEPASPDVPEATARFLGRWEGAALMPPIRGDWKYVLAVTSINPAEGTAYVWAATNPQFPAAVLRVRFRVSGEGDATTLEWRQTGPDGSEVISVRHAGTTDALEGTSSAAVDAGLEGRILLRRDTTAMHVDRDPAAGLAALGITWHPHEDAGLLAEGAGELVYLPPGYADEPDRRWPLVVFLHGSGDRGENGLVLALNSPFRWVTAGHDLDAVIVAPLLGADRASFPEAYLDGVLDDALRRYQVDPARVAVTGLSMGGEAAYRLARHRPDDIAALAVLCGFETGTFAEAIRWGYLPIEEPWSSLQGRPVLVIHGEDDRNVPVEAADAAVAAMRDAGVPVEFRRLAHHDHDVWSTTYEDPAFYAWLMDALP